MRRITYAVLVLLAALVGHVDARTVKNAELNYTLVVPDRLQQITPQAGMVDAFATSDPSKGMPDAVVTITRLHGTLGREHLDASKTPIPGVSERTSGSKVGRRSTLTSSRAKSVMAMFVWPFGVLRFP